MAAIDANSILKALVTLTAANNMAAANSGHMLVFQPSIAFGPAADPPKIPDGSLVLDTAQIMRGEGPEVLDTSGRVSESGGRWGVHWQQLPAILGGHAGHACVLTAMAVPMPCCAMLLFELCCVVRNCLCCAVVRCVSLKAPPSLHAPDGCCGLALTCT